MKAKVQETDPFLVSVTTALRTAADHKSPREAVEAIATAQGTAYKGFMLTGNYYSFADERGGRFLVAPPEKPDPEDRDNYLRIAQHAYLAKTEDATATVQTDSLFPQEEAGHTEALFVRLAAVDAKAVLKTAKVKMVFFVHEEITKKPGKDWCGRNTVITDRKDLDCRMTLMTVGDWEPMTKVQDLYSQSNSIDRTVWLQETDRIREIVAAVRPWVLPWIDKCVQDDQDADTYYGRMTPDPMLYRYLYAPWMEILMKAGYQIAREYFRRGDPDIPNNAVLRPGTKPSEIIRAEKWALDFIKHESTLWKVEDMAKFSRQTKLDPNWCLEMLSKGYMLEYLKNVEDILEYRHENGNPVFTYKGLMNYLERIDIYEASALEEGLRLLCDYLNTCQQIGMVPRIDSDSLMREHNVAARLHRQILEDRRRREEDERNQRWMNGMRERKEAMAGLMPALEYSENVYFIKPIYDYDVLIDEASQQHNCLMCYADSIAKGNSIVLQMRETANPEKSLISIELDPNLRTLRQVYLSSNRPVRNKSQLDFIDRWHKRLQSMTVNSKKVIRTTNAA